MITRHASEKYRCFNPAACVKPPSYERGSHKSEYALEEREKVLNILMTDIDGARAAALLALHVGELCALKWEDIDLDMGTVRIGRTLQRVSLDGGSKVCLIEFDESNKRTVPLQAICAKS